MAGVGFAIKPYYALLWLALECWLQLRNPAARAWLRRENQAIVGVQIVYAVAALLFASNYLDVISMARAAYFLPQEQSVPTVSTRLPVRLAPVPVPKLCSA